MVIKNLVKQLEEKGIFLGLLRRFLNNAMQLKNEMLGFVRESQRKLNKVLEEHPNSTEVSQLREKFNNDCTMLVNCELHIIEYQADIIATKNDIKKLAWLFSTDLIKKNHYTFYQKSEDDSNKENDQNPSPASRYANISNLPSR